MPAVEVNAEDVLSTFNEMQSVGRDTIQYASVDFWKFSVEEAPIKRGTLRGSIQMQQISDLSYAVGTALEYAADVHDGTPPHTITGNPWLYWPGAKHPVHEVHHPGFAGDPFFDRAAETVEGNIDEYLDMAMGRFA